MAEKELQVCEDDNVLIRTKSLAKTYGNKKVLEDVNLEIKRGEIYGFIGKNGSGKTTTMRLILGLCKPSKGSVEISKNVKRSDISAVIEYPAFFPNMDAVTNMVTQCKALGVKNSKKVSCALLSLMGLNPKDRSKVKNFSLGMKQRLAIAMSLICKDDSTQSVSNDSENSKDEISTSEDSKNLNQSSHQPVSNDSEATKDDVSTDEDSGNSSQNSADTNLVNSDVENDSKVNSDAETDLSLPDLQYPSVLLLDEPINGLDPGGIKEIREIILRLNKEKGVTFLISSHILGELEKTATGFIVISGGKIAAQFASKDLRKKVKGCIRMKTNNNEKAIEVLSSSLSIFNCHIKDGEILIFDDRASISDITKKMIENDLIIESISSETGNYENYFIKLMGGN